MNKKLFCIANWKMYLNTDESIDFIGKLSTLELNQAIDVVICPSFISLFPLANYNFASNISLGSQNVSSFNKGAYTGEISIDMIENLRCKWTIIGHSERRSLLNEKELEISKKFKIVMNSSISPILCVGESHEERKAGTTEDVLTKQINSAFNEIDFTLYNNKTILIAYEPVWSIGTGIAADIDTITDNINLIKNIIKNYNLNNCNLYILYGGSVNENNAKSILSNNNLDGFLIGSASLDPNVFASIINQI